ncbi:MAG: DUF3108 domain-containing protein [Burkholderiales bacterium]|nr:DUF3108 domain-containing protein [Burkholderiales bacterium]
MPAHTTPTLARRRPAWRLVLLTLVVLLAHWVVLRAAPLALAAHEDREGASSWAFTTRTIDAPPPARAAPTTQPVAVNPGRVAPIHAKAGKRPTQIASLFVNHSLEENAPPALDNTTQPATETIAPSLPVEPPTPETPTLLAAAEIPTPTAPKPLPVKTVRNFVIPPSARLKYAITGEVKGFPYYVNAELVWKQDGQRYDARMEISHFLLGSRVQTSTGALTAQGLEPTRFGDKVKSEVAAHFEREKGKITFSANTPDVPLLAGAQDQLSIFMQVASMLAGEPNGYPNGSTLAFQAVGPRSADSWVFTVGAMEQLNMPGGEISALRLWRDPAGEFDPKTEIWMAPELGYLPVRIRLTQRNGDFVDQQWRSTQK